MQEFRIYYIFVFLKKVCFYYEILEGGFNFRNKCVSLGVFIYYQMNYLFKIDLRFVQEMVFNYLIYKGNFYGDVSFRSDIVELTDRVLF